MAIVTSLITPPLLKATLGRVVPTEDESARLRREHASAASSVGSIQRVLVPIRPRPEIGDGATVKTTLLSRLAEWNSLAVTVMAAAESSQRGAAEETVRHTGRLLARRTDVSTRVVPGEPVAAVLAEAVKGYDLLLLGATEIAGDVESLFGSDIDAMIRMSPVPTLVVSARDVPGDWRPQRILVPTDGAAASQRAADVAFAVAGGDGAVAVLHVVAPELSPAVSMSDTGHVQRFDLAHQIVSEVRDRGEGLGVPSSTMIEMSADVESAILEAARTFEADLIVLGTSARTGTTRLFLGPRVERVLIGAQCPVVVLNSFA
jgi:nucleotide-binding universal stress UspA family protein